MAQVAYDLEHFAPQTKRHTPQLRVAKRQASVRKLQLVRMAKTLAGVLALMLMVSAVLYTQATVTELQSTIADKKQELLEEEAMYAYLSFELDNKTSTRSVEENAADMGLSRMSGGQVTYYRVDENEGITVKENPIAQFFSNAKNGLLSIFDFLIP